MVFTCLVANFCDERCFWGGARGLHKEGWLCSIKLLRFSFQYKKGVVGLNQIVRVGGRSTEPELSECNLNQLLRSRGYIDDVISEVHREIDQAKAEFDDVVVEMHRKTGISLEELLDSLSMAQVGTSELKRD